MTELPVWELSEEVEYIIKQMRNGAEPDGLKHLKVKSDSTSVAVCRMLETGLSYTACNRPSALDMINYISGLIV